MTPPMEETSLSGRPDFFAPTPSVDKLNGIKQPCYNCLCDHSFRSTDRTHFVDYVTIRGLDRQATYCAIARFDFPRCATD